MKIVLCTGGYDPLHSGHVAYFKAAKSLGDKLVIGVNSDKWLTRKKGRPFMPFSERAAIIQELSCVDEVIDFDDDDNTACNAIDKLLQTKSKDCKLVFANGGDRTNTNTPEYKMFKNHHDVEFAYGVGGANKKNSSSWILEEWKNPKTIRDWGWYRVLDEKPGYKIKELVIEPGKSLSNQRHFHRSEHWYVLQGIVTLDLEYSGKKETLQLHQLHRGKVIEKEYWHQAHNFTAHKCHILEVQYGEKCVENDIERRDS